MTKTPAAILIAVCAAATLAAHHSVNAEYDLSRSVEVKGVVTKVEWMNPHVWIYIDGVGREGATARWRGELQAAAGELTRKGWSSTSVKAGDTIVAKGNPALQAQAGLPATLLLVEVTLPDGTKLDGSSKIQWSPLNAK